MHVLCTFKCCFMPAGESDPQHLPDRTVIDTGEVLGHGAYADVLVVKCKGKSYAAKRYRMMGKESDMVSAFREHEILARIRHPNIVSYYGTFTLKSEGKQRLPVIVMEMMHQNLSSYLLGEEIITFETKLKILRDIANGLQHLHCQKPAVIHRDLTATNVLLTVSGLAKIGDFGNSRIVDICSQSQPLTSNPGTIDYMPPEAMEEYTEKLDIFSYGHLAIHIFIRERPSKLGRYNYKGVAFSEVQRRQKYIDRVKIELPEDHLFYSILIKCLDDDNLNRPSCEDILKCL